MIPKGDFSKLLREYPLYRRLKLKLKGGFEPIELFEFKFNLHCERDNMETTFSLKPEPWHYMRGWDLNSIADNLNRRVEGTRLNFSFIHEFSATCQYCQKYDLHIFIRVSGLRKGPLDDFDIELQKIGQFPPYEINPDRELLKFLNEENKENYKKAIICKSQDYGIASFSYLRRIVESEIVNIIRDIAKIDRHESQKIKDLLAEFERDPKTAKLIEAVFPYLPPSLSSLGMNPLKVLYSELSDGIHAYTEEECATRADSIDELLKFVIKKINQEQSEVASARSALRKLS